MPKVYKKHNITTGNLTERVRHIVKTCFNGKRLVVFSGGGSKELAELYKEAYAICEGGGSGSIIGRNSFQRPKDEALAMLDKLITIYSGI